jgi:hypothetical protein
VHAKNCVHGDALPKQAGASESVRSQAARADWYRIKLARSCLSAAVTVNRDGDDVATSLRAVHAGLVGGTREAVEPTV